MVVHPEVTRVSVETPFGDEAYRTIRSLLLAHTLLGQGSPQACCWQGEANPFCPVDLELGKRYIVLRGFPPNARIGVTGAPGFERRNRVE